MRLNLPVWGLAAQIPLSPLTVRPPTQSTEYAFKEAPEFFTPKDLVQLERPSGAVPNDAGDLAFVTISKYNIEEKKNHKSLVVFPLESTFQSTQAPVLQGGEFFWLAGSTLGQVIEKDDHLEVHALEVYGSYGASTADDGPLEIASESTLIGIIPSRTATNFKYNPASRHLVFSDSVYDDRNLTSVKEKDAEWENRGNSAFVYDTANVRFWDTWTGKKRSTLFSVLLQLNPDRNWLMGTEFHSPLRGTPHHSPVGPLGGTDDFDVSATHIVYTTKDPLLPEALHTKQDLYIVDIKGYEKPRELTSGEQGGVYNPVFDQQGEKVAWLQHDEDGSGSGRAKIIIYDLRVNVRYTLTQSWDRSPESLAFSPEGTFLFFTAGDQARIKVYYLPIPPTPSQSSTNPHFDPIYTTPIELTSTGAASSIYPLHPGRLLFSQSSLMSPNDVFLIQHLPRYLDELTQNTNEPPKGDFKQVTHFTEGALSSKGLSPGEEFHFKGAEDKTIQGWALKPRGWKEGDKKKWPVVLLIHGGPESAWEDQWSTRWNPNVFTGQGYFVIMINPTGSTTFGQELTDAITEDWGGKPFIDFINGWKYALEKYPEIDPDRAVAAGASWGGYAINWIQGHPEYGFGFKALVEHDGVFDVSYSSVSSDVPSFFNHEWGGRPWDPRSKELANKYSPSNFVSKWSTPQLLIHGSKDFRLPETESISAFHALQQLGVPSRLVIFPDENHWVLNPGNSLKWHYEVFRWFDQFVGKNEIAS